MIKFGNKKNDSNQKAGPKQTNHQQIAEKKELSAIKLQCMVRRFLSRRRVRKQAGVVWQRVYDPTFKRYFWFNRYTGKSSWEKSKYVDLYDERDKDAAIRIQGIIRMFLAKRKIRRKANERYQRFFDMENGKFYWFDSKTQKTFYNASKWLQNQNIDMPKEDQLLYQSYLKIKELEKKLADKDKEIKEVRKQRVEDLMPQLIQDKVKSAKNLQRSKQMDEWSIDDLAAFFTELKMDEYIPYLYANRVDGTLFVNLYDEDFKDMGITNRFHLKKLELIMKGYRIRYQRKKEKKLQLLHNKEAGAPETEDDEDDLISEYAPSELSAIIAAEENGGDDYTDGGSDEDDDSVGSEEDEVAKLTEEQRLHKRMDEQNLQIQILMQGDRENFPIIGDIVRVKYVCTLTENGKIVMSTKNILERPWVEFVLGVDQIIKGIDRALPLMCIGERSKIILTPEYGYGKAGLPPHIPPNASLTFDLTLLGFRPRTVWVKPLIQDVNTKERPYFKDLKTSLKMSIESGIVPNPSHLFSASMILNDDPLIKDSDNNPPR